MARVIGNRAGALLLALLVLVAAVGGYGAAALVKGAAQARAVAAVQAEARLRTIVLKKAIEGVANDFEQERVALASRADDADLALGRLRAQILAAGGEAKPTSGGDDAAVARTLLGNCAAEYRRMAGVADSLRAQLVTLQAYVRSVED
jgi:hypothetical protein